MPVQPRKNAVEQRLEELDDRWNEFADSPEPRLLCWVVDADSRQLVDGWVQLQCEGDGAVPDLFIRLESPFTAPGSYGFALIEELHAQVEQVRAELAAESDGEVGTRGTEGGGEGEGTGGGEEGGAAVLDWVVPPVIPGDPDVLALVRCCASFQAHHAERMLKLAVVLAPTAVADPAGWEYWLRTLVRAGVPDAVRFLVVDAAEAPLLGGLHESEPLLVAGGPVDLDMAGARAELAAGAAGEDPGSRFRVHFVALTSALEKGDLVAADGSARQALAIAGEQGWLTMQVVVYTALGSGYVGGGHTDHAVAAYQAARQTALAAAEGGDPAAPKLVVQAWLGEGSALVGAGRFTEAAQVYAQAAPAAAAREDPMMALEGWRMAAYCHEQAGDAESSWVCGHAALDAGEQLDEGMRQASTLPFVGQGLLRLTRQWAYAGQVDVVQGRMIALLGPGWDGAAQAVEGRTP